MKEVKINPKVRMQTLRSALELSELQVKLLKEKLDKHNLQHKIAEQEAIIAEAQGEIERLKTEHREAPAKIKIIERDARYNRKELVKLENARKIEQLLTAAAKLKELTDEDD